MTSMTLDRVVQKMDALVSKLKVIEDLEIPESNGRTLKDQVWWLRRFWTQDELRTLMDRCLKALDTFSHEDPEWDVLADMMDPVWYALDETNRP